VRADQLTPRSGGNNKDAADNKIECGQID